MKYLIVFLGIGILFTTPCYAVVSTELISERLDISILEEHIPSDSKNLLSDYDITSGQGLENVFNEIRSMIFETVQEQLRSIWQPAIHTLMIIIISGMISSVFKHDHLELPILIVGSTGIICVCLTDTKSYFTYCIDVIHSIYDFSTVLFPCLAGASVIGGASFSAGVKYTAAALFMNLLLNFSNTVLVPIVSIYLSCSLGNAIFQQPILGSISKFIRWGCIKVLSGTVILFTAYMSLAGILTGAGELLTARIAKTTISNGLPIVGKIISDTASTLVAGASMIRNSVGIFGMLAVISILAVPLVSVGVRYLLFKFVGEVSELFLENRFGNLLKSIEDTYGILFAIIGTGFIMLFLSIMSFMQLVGV